MKFFNTSYRKVGGLHFITLGRLGFTFYVSRPSAEMKQAAVSYHRAWLRYDETLGTYKPAVWEAPAREGSRAAL